ncbi:MAG: TusE/DsrC/DsvC family sulfur relay protein [Gammaproteobacteria bacterium]|nr:TusE/DsrC/DsvC family sulfur relay protein [Gammaproteobacteria bacterium]NIR98889.1 TusE/DsrC/DsvC family sulfur relay protein [Gammaproteobacteria bacterium]NIT64010.1 TusE/DsrC/DsvC family sulfur relay protein [Gammaproteobacteria bacterium]NIV19170.1 TusE/DsrC/DsvC family sulfur relay protein [Gammaproteobacteria bacterium]NIX10339.1 TusE/DsrC/DsvC family sulfur relay protein [Gammaproteobacteria bacterium]
MSDINKYIRSGEPFDPEHANHLQDLEGWDENQAQRSAGREGIELTAEHWEVIRFLREDYAKNGRARSGRVLSERLDEAFTSHGGRKHLYRLFPNGPVVQGSRIAGLPLPEYSRDDSFGYSQ